MAKKHSSHHTKSLVVFTLLAGLIASHTLPYHGMAWYLSPHAIVASLWLLLTFVHVWKHRKLIKALRLKRVATRNKITVFVSITFALMCGSIIIMALTQGDHGTGLHHIVGHIYAIAILLHIMTMFRRKINRYRKA